jgi:hypothetical protein
MLALVTTTALTERLPVHAEAGRLVRVRPHCERLPRNTMEKPL